MNEVVDPFVGSSFPIALLMGLLIIFQGPTASLIGKRGSFALPAVIGVTRTVLHS